MRVHWWFWDLKTLGIASCRSYRSKTINACPYHASICAFFFFLIFSKFSEFTYINCILAELVLLASASWIKCTLGRNFECTHTLYANIEQDLYTLPEHLRSSPGVGEVHVTQSLVFYLVFWILLFVCFFAILLAVCGWLKPLIIHWYFCLFLKAFCVIYAMKLYVKNDLQAFPIFLPWKI